MRYLTLGAAAVAAAASMTTAAHASGVTLTGDFLTVSVNDQSGTFGLGGNTRPAFVHDPSGTGSFDFSTDYIAPGAPHDGFTVIADQFSLQTNDNQGPLNITGGPATLLMGADAMGFANAASWTGVLDGFFEITNSYFFNPGDERVLIETSIMALSDLSGLAFNRSVDPDSGGTTSINQRGNADFGVSDFIGSESATNGRTLALINIDNGGFTNNTSIQSFCCSNFNPFVILGNTGGDLGVSSTGDNSLNLAYDLGDLLAGDTATFSYAYAAGEGLDDIIITPPGGAVPEPGTWAMMLLGFFALGGVLRSKPARVNTRVRYV